MSATGLDCSHVPPVPEIVMSYTAAHVAAQRVRWSPVGWESIFRDHDELLSELNEHASQFNGISRAFVHGLADRDPVDLFLATMAWGWGTVGIGPTQVAKILEQPDAQRKIREIVTVTRVHGAGEGWDALLIRERCRIPYLGMAYGTKLLYFAAYKLDQAPRPLILDARVRRSLAQLTGQEVVPPPGDTVWRDDYCKYLTAAECWAGTMGIDDSDVVEYALFDPAAARPDPLAESDDDDARPLST